ncbi:MAG TPA: DinB family protein [Verrucomicrobiae bacterium]|nr:DinB family protein [Verrucomicrobiae bacterium]
MKKLLLTLTILALTASGLLAQELSSEDRERGIKYLEKTRDAFVEASKDFSPAQWQFKPETNKWSAAQIAEHIAASEDFMMDTVRNSVMKAPPRAEGEDARAIDEFIIKNVPDRTQKFQAPEPLVPKNRFGGAQDALKHFKESRATSLALLKESSDLRKHAVDSPLGKKLDAYQWLLFMAAHSERHTRQLLELKSSPGFPKS